MPSPLYLSSISGSLSPCCPWIIHAVSVSSCSVTFNIRSLRLFMIFWLQTQFELLEEAKKPARRTVILAVCLAKRKQTFSGCIINGISSPAPSGTLDCSCSISCFIFFRRLMWRFWGWFSLRGGVLFFFFQLHSSITWGYTWNIYTGWPKKTGTAYFQ